MNTPNVRDLQPKKIPWNKGKKGAQVAWNKGKKMDGYDYSNTGKHPNSVKNRFSKGHDFSSHPNVKKTQFKKGVSLSENIRKKLVGRIPWNKGIKRYNSKEKHPQWKGGITKTRNMIRGCFEYRQWRSDIFHRDNYTCVLCSKRGGWIEADHYPKRFSVVLDENLINTIEKALSCAELWSINNGRTLCASCHKKVTWKM